MSQTFHWRHSNTEVTLAACWNTHAPASAPFHQVLWNERRGSSSRTHARPLHPTSCLTWKGLSLAILWSQRKVRIGMRCLPGFSVTCMKFQSMDPDWSRQWLQRGDILEAQKWALLNVVWWGGVVVDLTTCPSAHRLSGWQPGMSAVLHCPCPCSLREVWNRQLWSDSSFQKCWWERRRKKAIRRAEMSSQIPIFPSAITSKAKIFTVEEIYCACVRPLKSSTASSPL